MPTSSQPSSSLPLSRLAVTLCCVGVLAGAPALAQAPSAPTTPAAPAAPGPLGRGQLAFGVLGQPLHTAPNGPVKGTVQGAPVLLLEEGPAGQNGRRWFRVLAGDLSQGWLSLASTVRHAPVELRAASGVSCSPDDARCQVSGSSAAVVPWNAASPLSFLEASTKPRCISPLPCMRQTPWLKLTDGTTEAWVDADAVSLTWAPVDAAPEGRPCALHLAYGLQGLVRGPFLRRPEWAELGALVQVPSSPLTVSEPLATVQLSNGRLTLWSKECRRQEFATLEDGLVDLAAFQCIAPDTCQHALLLETRHRSERGDRSKLYVISGTSFRLPQVQALELSAHTRQGADTYREDASWWVESAPRAEGGALWIVRALKEHVEGGKAKPPRVGVEQVDVGPVGGHPEHPAHPTPRAYQAILLAEEDTREGVTMQLGRLEACLGQPIPRFELLRGGRWVHAAGRLFETQQQAAAWKAAVHRCGMKKGFTFATLPSLSRP